MNEICELLEFSKLLAEQIVTSALAGAHDAVAMLLRLLADCLELLLLIVRSILEDLRALLAVSAMADDECLLD